MTEDFEKKTTSFFRQMTRLSKQLRSVAWHFLKIIKLKQASPVLCQQKIHTFARSDSVVTKKMTAERRKLLGLSTKA